MLFGASSSTVAQNVKVSFNYERNPTRKLYRVFITNQYEHPITAWAFTSSDAKGCGFVWQDCVINYLRFKPIASKETREFSIGHIGVPGQESHSEVHLWGVLFADGQSWGDPDWVNNMIAARRRILDDIPKAAELLTQAKGEVTADRLALVSQFKKLSLRL